MMPANPWCEMLSLTILEQSKQNGRVVFKVNKRPTADNGRVA